MQRIYAWREFLRKKMGFMGTWSWVFLNTFKENLWNIKL